MHIMNFLRLAFCALSMILLTPVYAGNATYNCKFTHTTAAGKNVLEVAHGVFNLNETKSLTLTVHNNVANVRSTDHGQILKITIGTNYSSRERVFAASHNVYPLNELPRSLHYEIEGFDNDSDGNPFNLELWCAR